MSLLDNLFGKEKTSESANLIGHIFNVKENGLDLLDMILARFEHFDEFNRANEDRNFFKDLNYILQSSIDSLISKNSSRFKDRIDSYFYVYRRMEEYCELEKKSLSSIGSSSAPNLKNFREKLYELLSSTFASSNGVEPNLRADDNKLLKHINLPQHLTLIKTLDTDSSTLFFAVCKLSMQSSFSSDHLTWMDILSKVQDMKVSLEYLITEYLRYVQAFQQFPFDTPAYIYLIGRKHPRKDLKSPFVTIIAFYQKLNLPEKEFFDLFLPIFSQGIRDKRYETKHVSELFKIFSRSDYLFEKYLSNYASIIEKNDLWSMSIELCTIADINDTIKKYLIEVLTKHLCLISKETFHGYTQSIRECLTKIQPEFHVHLLQIFEQIYDAFILTQIPDPKYSYRFRQSDLKELLKIGLELTSTHSIKRSSCLLLVRKYLFKIDDRIKNPVEKIKSLFDNFNQFDEHLCRIENPAEIIDDDRLKDFLLTNTQIWLRLDENIYEYLCAHHRNNRWIIYLWTRIIHLSLLKFNRDRPNEMLLKLNQWMRNVQHENYDRRDSLTLIFVEKLFELVISKHAKSIASLPNVEIIMQFLFSIKHNEPNQLDAVQIDCFIENGEEILQEILQLKGTTVMYRDLLKGSILSSFLPFIDLNETFNSVNPQFYKFQSNSSTIDSIISLKKPGDIDIIHIQSFAEFLEQINQWLQWFDRFNEIFQPIFYWLKSYNVTGAQQFFNDLHILRNNPQITFIQIKTIIENIAQFLQSITDLRRLCHLFNCLTSFRILDHGTLNIQENTNKYLQELKRLQPNNKFTIERENIYEHIVTITDRQLVQWSLASDNHLCDIKIIYQTSDHQEILFEQENVAINKHVLYGQFETSQVGQLRMILHNKQPIKSSQIWYRIKKDGLSTCQLFQGIFHLFYKDSSNDNYAAMTENEFDQLLHDVFVFIDKILNGSLTLREMTRLQMIFCDQNIHIEEEVKKLYISRSNHHINQEENSNEKEIQQICDWLRIYQYYSHINIIVDCIEKFDILPVDNVDVSDLRRLGGNENCSLREITEAYRILQEKFQNLTHQHLQLIKIAVECANVVDMMTKADFYSLHGQRRFQELRDNLTTQFQLQEKNNMILNSWIMTYTWIEPFVLKAKHFHEFVSRVTQVAKFEESSLNHIKIISDNIQIVNMWISAEASTVLDHALINMEHLFNSGTVNIYLRHLMNEQSYFEISYTIDRDQDQTLNDTENGGNLRKVEKIKFTLSMADMDDHKRQLIFCNVDVEQNEANRKVLIKGQLKLLEIVEKIYTNLIKLELSGHPYYQLREEPYPIYLLFNQNNSILSDLRNYQDIQIENAIKERTGVLESVATTSEARYTGWIDALKKYRDECPLLQLFSNRQIMFLIILLRTSTPDNSIRNCFLKNLFSLEDLNPQSDEEQTLSIQCLIHYLRSLRINQDNLSYEHMLTLYTTYQIESGSEIDVSLKKLSRFLRDLFHNGEELFDNNRQIEDNNQQYLVTLNPTQRTPEQITFEHDFDMHTCCILLNIFHDRLPASYQILWGTNATEEDIHLFFARIRTFQYLTFVIMDIDKMHHRLREVLFNEQASLTRYGQAHGIVYYFSRELTTVRKGLREFQIPADDQSSKKTYKQLIALFQRHHSILPHIQIVYGTAGIGKTHRINTHYKDQSMSCFSINDKLDLSWLISSFLLFDSNQIHDNPTIYFNISIHAPFEALNRTLFSLFICGSLKDHHSGLTFSLPIEKPWRFVIEIPYSDVTQLSIRENFDQILPLLSIISSSNLEEVTNDNYQLFIGEEEEVVARFLKAFENGTIDRMSTTGRTGVDVEVEFDRIIDPDECRMHIHHCIDKYASELPQNKIYQLSFTKFLYRRVKFFLGKHYRLNETTKQLGSTAMRQMIDEAKALTRMNFEGNHFPRIYLVYDDYFSLQLLYVNWNDVSDSLKSLFYNQDPLQSKSHQNKDYFAECLAWLINIRYGTFMEIIHDTKFILTENFAYKLFHIHERKLTKLALIIEGDTGVGKTFLLKFYSLLLNSKYRDHVKNNNITPRFIENSSLFLQRIINETLVNQAQWLNAFLLQIQPKLLSLDTDKDDLDEQNINQNLPINLRQQEDIPADMELLKEIKLSLGSYKYNKKVLSHIWKTILITSTEHAKDITATLIQKLHNYITTELANYPLIEASSQCKTLLQKIDSPTANMSIEIFKEYLFSSLTKPLFYRLLLHPGITEEQLVDFMFPISQLARELPQIELVVFFDEVNTSSCLGLFKEMFMDGTLHGTQIPKNIFFTAAINPLLKLEDHTQVHRRDYLVHELPQSLKYLKVTYGALESRTLADYIIRKFEMFQVHSSGNERRAMNLERQFQNAAADSIVIAHKFCEKYLGQNSVSQREIQRCFNLMDFFWTMRYDDETEHSNPDPIRCIALSIALIYYFRLPTVEDNIQRGDTKTPSREDLAEVLSGPIPNFEQMIQNELVRFVNDGNFVIPQGVAINQAVREHIFSIVASIATRTPLCIIGVPGQSKTLSFQIVLQNLQGAQLSIKSFCKRLPAIDPFFCLGSKYTSSEDIAYMFDRAIKREQQYEQNHMKTQCVVFLDEASLPNEKKMVLKVLHPYLDECKVAFVAVTNQAFDAANANRMICIYRSLPSESDQKILAYGCLGLQTERSQRMITNDLERIIYGLCQGYRRILYSPDIPHIFHDRDFIYMLRELRFELVNNHENQEMSIGEITPRGLLRALEDNFNGIKHEEFEKLITLFFTAVCEIYPTFELSPLDKQQMQRNIPTILRESMKLDSNRRRLYGRYKLIIDESEDESAVRLLSQSNILGSDPTRTNIFRMSDFPDDINNEFRNVEMLSTIKLCMETGKTILMVNTGRIHGSLYDVFNQNFSIMATDDTRKIFSKVAIGPKTIDVVVHEDFQCIVHIKRSEIEHIPPPFLSRFQKYSLSIIDFYHIELQQLSEIERNLLKNVETKIQEFINHFGAQYFYGLNDNTLYSCLLSLIKQKGTGEYYLLATDRSYTQLTIQSKSFIEQNPLDHQQCLLFFLMSKLLQLVSPESMIYKLPTFEDTLSRLLCANYFYQQEHFNIEHFLQRLISPPSIEVDSNYLFSVEDDFQEKLNEISITRKVLMFTRTSSFVLGLNNQTKEDLFNHQNDVEYNNFSEKMDVINLISIENSVELRKEFRNYEQDANKKVLMIIIDGRINQQCLHIPYVRQLIDETDQDCNVSNQPPRKFFLILLHSSSQEMNVKSSFPSIFLANWDYYFLDTSTPGSAFHLQKILQSFTSSFGQSSSLNKDETIETNLCDYNILFDDCLWEFCSRIQIFAHKLPREMFQNSTAYEFYQTRTTTIRRVHSLKELLRQLPQFQERLMTDFHEAQSKNREFLLQTCHLNYQISKEILCGKRLTSLVDSFQSEIRLSLTNFISNFLKFLINDYGLETLSKLSTIQSGYHSLLDLIDYSSFSSHEDDQTSPSVQNNFLLRLNYFFIPQTPLYYLFHERIKSIADQIKSTLVQRDEQKIDDLREDYYAEPRTTIFNYDESVDSSTEEFRNELSKSLLKDKILTKIISRSILESYTNDSVQKLCTTIETNFDHNLHQCQQTIDFMSKWLLSIDDNNQQSFDLFSNRDIWLLAQVYTFLEYEQKDLFSLYSACRILESLDPTAFFSIEKNIHSKIHDQLFRLVFEQLWKKLLHICSTNDQLEQWVQNYTFIYKYYPSKKVLQHRQLIDMKGQIEFMHLAYLIFLNDNTPEPRRLVLQLLKDTSLMEEADYHPIVKHGTSVCLRFLSTILQTIDHYFENQHANHSTLMIDVQQWILSMIKVSQQSCREEILYLFRSFDQLTCQLSFSMKQFLFDELANIFIQMKQQNRTSSTRLNNDFWDRLSLLPTIIESLSDKNLEHYQLPYHPSVINNETNQKQILLSLYFFHLQRLADEQSIKWELIHKILLSVTPQISDQNLKSSAEFLFNQLKDYFILHTTALFLCQSDLQNHNSQRFDPILTTVIKQYLSINRQSVQPNQYLQLFLSIIITKRSWTFLFNLLQSELFQRINAPWANRLYHLFQSKQTSSSLQFSHRLQFTLTTNPTLAIFPAFHQPYQELSRVIEQCIRITDQDQRWKVLIDWIEMKLNVNPPILNATEIKVMLLLNVYYEYYCNDQLIVLDGLLAVIDNTLRPSMEELRVFRVFFQPLAYMIGYPNDDTNADRNELNDLFKLDRKDNKELNIRHSLVNLLAMILLSGKQNFLWTFTFQPSKLQKTFGFGSAQHKMIENNGVHYDCGCKIGENGDFDVFLQDNVEGSALTIPAAYVALFSTFGALTWHLLLFDSSTENLYGPLLTKDAVDKINVGYRLARNSIRAKLCHFVRAHLLSTFHFLSLHSNEDDACIILNRCFERMAQLNRGENSWIKPIYARFGEKIQAEEEYQDQIFNPIYQQLGEYKKLITTLNQHSQIQQDLEDYIFRMPISIQFQDFKAELSNWKNSQLPLDTLRYLLQSFDHLKMTNLIYDLSQFYLLLHRIYGQLIEQHEFSTITLKELHERAEKQSKNSNLWKYPNQKIKHFSIIENGIKAVNTYHQSTNGLIQLEANDEPQRFTTISIDTPISSLVTTDNHDEGDIIMRILSILVNYHNKVLNIMERHHGIGLLTNLVNHLTSREISILQITEDNTGVITLNDNDCLWIEQLSRASLETEEYFLKFESTRNFNFLYVQSCIIRSYLLVCRINHRHIVQKYHFYIPRKTASSTSDEILNEFPDSDFEDEWNHLKKLNLDKLDNGHRLLRRIIDLLETSLDETSKLNLYEYLQTIDNQNELIQQCEQNQIKDFPLNQIQFVCHLYEKIRKDFQHSFINVSQSLRLPIDMKLNVQLDERFYRLWNPSASQEKKEILQLSIQMITDLLNDLEDKKEFLLNQSSRSLKQTCLNLLIKNNILELIPVEIKCQNYVPLGMKLIEIRTKLQEKAIQLEEKNTSLWNAKFDVSISNEQTIFQRFKNPHIDLISDTSTDFSLFTTEPIPDLLHFGEGGPKEIDLLSFDFNDSMLNTLVLSPSRTFFEKIDYPSLFELTIQSIPLISSVLFNEIREQTNTAITTPTKGVHYKMIYADRTNKNHLCKIENLNEKLKEIFEEKKYHSNQFVIIDQKHLVVNLRHGNNSRTKPHISSEYRVIERSHLICVILEWREKEVEYFVTREARISSIINRFIIDQDLELTLEQVVLGFFDGLGKYIEEDGSINDIYQVNNVDSIRIRVVQSGNDMTKLAEITLCAKEGQSEIQKFDLRTNWKQISIWLDRQSILNDVPVNTCDFFDREHQDILDKHQSISSTLGDSTSLTIDVINGEDITEIILSYDKHEQRIRLSKSCPVSYLLHHPQYLQGINLKTTPEDCSLVLIMDRNERILSNEEIQQSIGYYSISNHQILHFQIAFLIQLIPFDDPQTLQISISNRNLTIQQFLESKLTNKSNHHLASIDTHMIIPNNNKLSDINQNKFYLVKEDQICSISIEQIENLLIDTDDHNTTIQQYIIHATINDIYKQNISSIQNQYLVHENDFIPSPEIPLTSFLSSTSPIQFQLTHRKFPINLTVINEEEQTSIQFFCLPSISTTRICRIACRLLHLNERLSCIMHWDDSNVDDDYSFDRTDQAKNGLRLKIKEIKGIQCRVMYDNQTIFISSSNEMLASTILKESLKKLAIPKEDIHLYQLNAMDDPENPSNIDLGLALEDICLLFPEGILIIPLQLEKI